MRWIVVAVSLASTGCLFAGGADRDAGDPWDVGDDAGPQPDPEMGPADAGPRDDVRPTAVDTGPGTPPPVPPCEEEMPPERCGGDPSSFEWPPGSVIAGLEIRPHDGDDACCFDLDADGVLNNKLGDLVFGVFSGTNFDTNGTITERIDSGQYAVMFEFDGVEDATAASEFSLFAYRVRGSTPWTPEPNSVEVVLDDLESGTQPRFGFEAAEIDGGVLQAEGGELLLALPLFGAPSLTVPLRQVVLEAEVDDQLTSLPDGIGLMSGKGGGAVRVSDFARAVSDFAESECGCLGLGRPLLTTDPLECTSHDVGPCRQVDKQVCVDLGNNCDLFKIVGNQADVDLNGDGTDDATSIGFQFTGYPARVTGVAD